MIITWHGEGCFRIQSGNTTVLSDPLDSSVGLTPSRIKPDILVKTLTAFPPLNHVEGGHIISGAGEFNIGSTIIQGHALTKESSAKFLKTVFEIEIEGISIVLFGHISEYPEAEVLERLSVPDIIILPGGGKPFLDEKQAVKLIKTLEPKIVLPSFFKVQGLKRQSQDIKTFLNEFNGKNTESADKLSIRKKELSEVKATKIIVLKN